MIEFLLLDLDDTILDFHKAEYVALSKTLRSFGIEPTDEVCALYSRINKDHWEMLERKEITRPQVLLGRFETLFRQVGMAGNPEDVAAQYEENLAFGHFFLPGAEEALQALFPCYKLYLVSNGTAKVQAGRLESAGISKYFQEIFVSQTIGADKPDKVYFDRCFARIPGLDREKAMIVGDSLTSDILGGINAGIATCWVAPGDKPVSKDICPDYRIGSLGELPGLLREINAK